jgi:hypothetical protein
MSIILRFTFTIFCAYAGSRVASAQFAELPADSFDLAQK